MTDIDADHTPRGPLVPAEAGGAPSDPEVGRRLRWFGWAVMVTALIVLPIILSPLDLNRFSRDLVLVLAVLGVNMLTGHGGLISLGHGVFVGIGAFAMANLIDLGIPLLGAGLLATVITGLFGIILGLPALRVRGRYLALITFAIALAFAPVAKQFASITGGSTGRRVNNDGFTAPDFMNLDGSTHVVRYAVTLAVVAVWFLLARNLVNSRVGRSIRAVSQNEPASASFGINVRWAKTGVLGVSAAMAGTAGAMIAILNPFLLHTNFDALLSFRIYAAAVIGGVGSLIGTVLGAVFLLVIPELTDTFGFLGNDAIAFGLMLIIITFVAPRGLAGLVAPNRGKERSSDRV